MYSVFEDCFDLTCSNTQLDSSMIDGTCDLGDLQEAFVMAKATKAEEQAMIYEELNRFLHPFFEATDLSTTKGSTSNSPIRSLALHPINLTAC